MTSFAFSSIGCLVVDCCLVPAEELDSITNFMVKTMFQCEAVLCRNAEGYHLPDHSVLYWDLVVGNYVCDSLRDTSKGSDRRSIKYVVPEEYMTNDADFIQSIKGDLKAVAGDQRKLCAVYSELVKGMKKRLKEVNYTSKEKGQPWFTRELAGLRKVMHQLENG